MLEKKIATSHLSYSCCHQEQYGSFTTIRPLNDGGGDNERLVHDNDEIIRFDHEHTLQHHVKRSSSQEEYPDHIYHDIPMAICMWLSIYEDDAMEQARVLLEKYVTIQQQDHQQQHLHPINTTKTIPFSSSSSSSTCNDEMQGMFNLVMYNWKDRWISQQAYWQTPQQMFERLQELFVLVHNPSSTTTISTDGHIPHLNVPFQHVFHVLLEAGARGIITEQAYQKHQEQEQGISFGVMNEMSSQNRNDSSSNSNSPAFLSSVPSYLWAVDFAEQVLEFLQQQQQASSSFFYPPLPVPIILSLKSCHGPTYPHTNMCRRTFTILARAEVAATTTTTRRKVKHRGFV